MNEFKFNIKYGVIEISPENYSDIKYHFTILDYGEYENTEDTLVVSDGTVSMNLHNFTFNLILLLPFAKHDIPVTINDLFLCEFNEDNFTKYMNHIIDKLINTVDINELKDNLLEINYDIANIAYQYNVINGNTIDVFGLIKLAISNKEVNDLIHYTIDENKSIVDSEKLIAKNSKKLLEILAETETSLRPYIKGKVGFKEKQLRECFLTIGYRPDLKGNIFPTPIDSNYIMGLNSIEEYYVNAVGARKSIITNFKSVKKAGYLTRRLLMLTCTIELSDIEDCHTAYTIEYPVLDQDSLDRIHGRYLVNESGNLEKITKYRTELIGYTINLRSPITCACSDNKICKTCYGPELATVNQGLTVGIIATLFLTNIMTQMLLSSKHLLRVDASEIDWPSEFEHYFDIKKKIITPKQAFRFKILINTDDLEYEDNNEIFTTVFSVNLGDMGIKEIESPVPLYLCDKIKKEIKVAGNIELENLALHDKCFSFITANKEFAKSINEIEVILDNKSHLINSDDIFEIFKVFLSKIKENHITINSVHLEAILKNLVRKKHNKSEYFNFADPGDDEYTVLTVKSALVNHPSVTVSLSFERILSQLKNPETYFKDNTSKFDKFYEY